MGRVNNTWAYDQKYVKRYGKLEKQPEKPVIGKLHIGGKTFDVTYQELDMIAKTMNTAKETVNKRYKLGMMR